MRMYKPQEIADRMIREAVPLETDFCLAADVAELRKAQRQLELQLLDRIEMLTEALEWYADEIRYKATSISMCGHATGQSILLDGGMRARKALAPEAEP